MNRPSEKPEKKKKPYQSPKLLVYGKLAEMTLTKGKKFRSDAGHGQLRFTGN
jgi:hypothetical protein